MKFLLIMMLSGIFNLQAQNGCHNCCISDAQFPGGNDALQNYLSRHLVYPERARKEQVEGKVIVYFMVEKDGSIGMVKLKRGIINCPECNEEAIRLIKSMPKWTPSTIHGEAKKSFLSLPISFKIIE